MQPAEEPAAGAKAMLNDGLHERFSRPDYALATHVTAGTWLLVRFDIAPATPLSIAMELILPFAGLVDMEPHLLPSTDKASKSP